MVGGPGAGDWLSGTCYFKFSNRFISAVGLRFLLDLCVCVVLVCACVVLLFAPPARRL
jgi:hypothetical protein